MTLVIKLHHLVRQKWRVEEDKRIIWDHFKVLSHNISIQKQENHQVNMRWQFC